MPSKSMRWHRQEKTNAPYSVPILDPYPPKEITFVIYDVLLLNLIFERFEGGLNVIQIIRPNDSIVYCHKV